MSVMRRNGAIVVAIGLLAGCTSLTSYSDRKPNSMAKALPGVRYSLPMRQWEVVISATLAQCQEPVLDPQGKPTNKFSDKVKIVFQKPVVKARDIPGESYFLNYTALGGWTKTTSISIQTFDTGTLKSIDATADDKTAEIVASTVKTGLGIAALAAGVPPGFTMAIDNKGIQQTGQMVCTSSGKQLMSDLASLKGKADNTTKALGDVTDKIVELAKRQPVYGLTVKEKDRLSRLLDQQSDLASTLSALQDKITKQQEKLGITKTHYWPKKPEHVNAPAAFIFDDASLKKFDEFLAVQLVTVPVEEDAKCGSLGVLACLKQKLNATGQVERLVDEPDDIADVEPGDRKADDELPSSIDTRAAAGNKGIYIRPPAPGQLFICRGLTLPCDTDTKSQIYSSDAEMIPQLGYLQFLPFENKAFQNNVIALSLRQDGSVEKLEYKTLKSAGQVASAMASDVVGQWTAFVAARDKAKDDAAAAGKQAELDDLQHQVDLLTKQQELEKLTTPKNDELIGLQAETTMTQARVAQLEAQLAEKRAKEALTKEGG